jgi:hypothetical protein
MAVIIINFLGVLGFAHSAQRNKRLTEALTAAGFTQAHMVEPEKEFCILAVKAQVHRHLTRAVDPI